jgi:sulfur-carrier protein
VVQVRLTRHLLTFFPQLDRQPLELEGQNIAELVRGLEQLAPGIAFYLCDEHGRLRPHVNVFIGNSMIRDRRTLSDSVAAHEQVSILQALSGG